MYSVNHSWLYGAIKPYFEKNGIKLLRDDMLFIEKCLSKVPHEAQKKVMRNYYGVWSAKTGTHDSVELKAVNPRYEANVYLRQATGAKGALPH